MIELFAFRRLFRIVALALCSLTIVAVVTPASARPHHGAGRHARAYHAGHHARHYHHHRHIRHVARVSRARGLVDSRANSVPNVFSGDTATYGAFNPGAFGSSNEATEPRRIRRTSRWERGIAKMQARSLAGTQASFAPEGANITMTAPASFASSTTGSSSGGSSNVVAEARRYLGGNPTGRGSLWCARFMNLVLQHSGYRGTGSDMARSFASYGQRVSGPQVGAIAVMSRGRGGGHVGVITGIDAKGNPIMISGNNGNRVREAPISRGRIYAYVMPTS